MLFLAVFAVIAALGRYRMLGTNPPAVLLVPFVASLGTGVVEEIVPCGLFFRLAERRFGAAHLANPHARWFAGLVIALEAGVLLAARCTR